MALRGHHVSQLLRGLLPLAPAAGFRQFASKTGAASLAYEELTTAAVSKGHAPAATVMLLHGLLGSGRNWRTFARKLISEAETLHHVHLRVLLIDLRNHGSSSLLPGLNPPHNLESAAGDVIQVMQRVLPSHTPPLALIGHSLGGKISLEALRQLSEAGELLPQQTWVLDAPPGIVTKEIEAKTGVTDVLKMVHEIQLPVPSRQALLQHLRNKGLSEATAQWLGSNLVPDEHGRLGWSFKAQNAAAMYSSYRLTDCWGVIEQPPTGAEVHLVQGAVSDRWSTSDTTRLTKAASSSGNAGRGRFHHHVLDRAGHNVHIDNQQGLMHIMLGNLVRKAKAQQM